MITMLFYSRLLRLSLGVKSFMPPLNALVPLITASAAMAIP